MFFESLDAHYLVAVGGKPVDSEDMANTYRETEIY